jgi:hypothetical protein
VVSGTTATITCRYSGQSQFWVVPAGVSQASFTLYGAKGGDGASGASDGGAGGLGAVVTGTLSISAGTGLVVNVGQAGSPSSGPTFGGGGAGGDNGGAGGGASDIRGWPYALADQLMVAGGGGGGGESGYDPYSPFDDYGGAGGNQNLQGQSGGNALEACDVLLYSGSGGDPDGEAGGAGGAITADNGCGDMTGGNGGGGGLGSGGNGGTTPDGGGGSYGLDGGGGGGGGGYYGGGGGGSGAFSPYDGPTDDAASSGAGGGGGSSYEGAATNASVTAGSAPDASGNGEVIITYQVPPKLKVSTTSLPHGTVGKRYDHGLSAINGTPPYRWELHSGALPAGLKLSKAGVIAGVPTKARKSRFTVEVIDSVTPNGRKAVRVLSITVVRANQRR